MNQVYIGWDSRASIAFDVARHSIWTRTTNPFKAHPLKLKHLGMLTRPIERRDNQLWCPISNAPMSTEFAISRFCVPFLQEKGWALFIDCDIICWEDIGELFSLANDNYAVMCVKHRSRCNHMNVDGENCISTGFLPRCRSCREIERTTKMDGQAQTYYARKNWSSVVLWNLDHPANKKFTLDNLNTWSGRDLHAFKWLEDSEIGELPQKWNWLINVTFGAPEKTGIWHYTLGGPWFKDWKATTFDSEWIKTKQEFVNSKKLA